MSLFLEVSLLLFGALCAGFLGALSGFGGGIVIVPLLVLGMGVDIHYAIGTSLIAVIATSTGSSVAYVKEGYTNVKAGILMETASCLGALIGVAIGIYLPKNTLMLMFGIILLYLSISGFYSNQNKYKNCPPDFLGSFLKLNGTYPTKEGKKSYHVQHIPTAYAIMWLAGALSGILGIGSGALKVLALDQVMHMPFKVSTTTSNFMIGATAATSAGFYLKTGYIDPLLTMPIVFGISIGSFLGAKLLPKIKTRILRNFFSILILIIALQLIINGIK